MSNESKNKWKSPLKDDHVKGEVAFSQCQKHNVEYPRGTRCPICRKEDESKAKGE